MINCDRAIFPSAAQQMHFVMLNLNRQHSTQFIYVFCCLLFINPAYDTIVVECQGEQSDT
jgi:hypothetical protein